MPDTDNNKKGPYFFRARLTYLCGIKSEDYSKIADWVNEPEFNKLLYQGWKPVDAESIREQFDTEKRDEAAIQFAQCQISDDQMIGWCGLYRWEKIAHSAEIRSFVGTSFWNRGYGTEQYAMLLKIGFERYNLNRIYFGTHQDNKGTLKIYEKIGAIREGVLRQITYRNGKYSDGHMFSVLRSDYEEKVKKLCSPYLE